MVRDLGSSNGTALGPRPVTSPAEIRDGDVLVLGDVRVRLEDPQSPRVGGPPTAILPPAGRTPSGVREPEPEARFSVGDQWARGTINNVEGSQNNYVHQILQQRESFLREVAATRTKARWFIWLGLILSIVGLAMFFYAFISAGISFSSVRPGRIPNMPNMEMFLIGIATAAVGQIMIMVGIVFHVIATARRRRVEERLPIPAPRPPAQ
jgi:hypothetical protein